MTTYEKWNLIITGVTGAAIFATFFVYWRQLKAMRHASAAQNMLALVNFMQTEDVRDARRVVIKELVNRPFSSWKPGEERAAALVCSNYGVAAIVIREGLVPADPFIKNWGPSIKLCHNVLKDYIINMRKPENAGPTYWDDFDWLQGEVCK